jgi:hypothetical protein
MEAELGETVEPTLPAGPAGLAAEFPDEDEVRTQ